MKRQQFLRFFICNLLLALSIMLLVKFTIIFTKPQFDKADAIDLENIALQTEEKMQETVEALKGFALFLLLAVILFVLAFIIIWSFFQSLAYHPFQLRFFEKFLVLNVILIIPTTILFILSLYAGRNLIFPVILLFLALHFMLFIYPVFAKEPELRRIGAGIKLSITKFPKLLIPYIAIAVTFIITSFINLDIISPLLYIVLFSWVQHYTRNLVR
ncbi:MAG TPA: hypothetical protein VFF28_01495 [Candidatus Nanoarchaeia archaeon]|nr:hypothetical protein [Candidatus Nanoarchaeia archaeon]